MNTSQPKPKIPKCRSCYPRISRNLCKAQHEQVAFETIRILNGLYSLFVGLVTGVSISSYTRYSKIIGLLMALSFFFINKKFLKVSH